jgi:hypothetical protein
LVVAPTSLFAQSVARLSSVVADLFIKAKTFAEITGQIRVEPSYCFSYKALLVVN